MRQWTTPIPHEPHDITQYKWSNNGSIPSSNVEAHDWFKAWFNHVEYMGYTWIYGMESENVGTSPPQLGTLARVCRTTSERNSQPSLRWDALVWNMRFQIWHGRVNRGSEVWVLNFPTKIDGYSQYMNHHVQITLLFFAMLHSPCKKCAVPRSTDSTVSLGLEDVSTELDANFYAGIDCGWSLLWGVIWVNVFFGVILQIWVALGLSEPIPKCQQRKEKDMGIAFGYKAMRAGRRSWNKDHGLHQNPIKIALRNLITRNFHLTPFLLGLKMGANWWQKGYGCTRYIQVRDQPSTHCCSKRHRCFRWSRCWSGCCRRELRRHGRQLEQNCCKLHNALL